MRTFLGIDFTSDENVIRCELDCPCATCQEDREAEGMNAGMERVKWQS